MFMAKAMLKAMDAQGLGMVENVLQLQLVKRKQSLETVVMFTRFSCKDARFTMKPLIY